MSDVPGIYEVWIKRTGEAMFRPSWISTEWEHVWPMDGLAMLEIRVAVTVGLLVNVAPDGQSRQLMNVEKALPDDTLVRLYTVTGGQRDQIIFEGFPDRYQFDAQADGRGGSELVCRIVCAAYPAVMGDPAGSTEDVDDFVAGQPMIRKDDLDKILGTPGPPPVAPDPGHEPAWRICRALDCIGNPNGTGNCRRTLLDVSIEGQGGETLPVPLFQHPLAPGNFMEEPEARQPWTYARWLLLLLAWPRMREGRERMQAWKPEGGESKLRLSDRCVFDGQTGTIVQVMQSASRRLDLVNPDDQEPGAGEGDPWSEALIGNPRNIVGEAFTWARALDAWVLRTGVHYCWDVRAEGERVWHELRFFVDDHRAARRADWNALMLSSPGTRTDGMSWQQVREKNNVTGLHVVRDYTPLVNRIRSVGAASVYEVTTAPRVGQHVTKQPPRIVPLWKPNADWDPENAGQVEDMVAAAASQAFADKYSRDGTLHYADENNLAGRWWGLPDAGDRTDKVREFGEPPTPFGPWGSPAFYATTDLQNFLLGEIPTAGEPTPGEPPDFVKGHHFVRGREFMDGITAREADATKGIEPFVEVSFNNGDTWRMLTAAVVFLPRAARIRFDIPDLRTLVDPSSGMSFVEAYIRGVLRIRVTAGIEGDAVPSKTLESATAFTLGKRRRSRHVDRRFTVQTRVRDDRLNAQGGVAFSGGNSQYKGGELEKIERWDRDKDSAAVRALLRYQDRVHTRASVSLPGIVLYDHAAGTGLRPGDLVRGIRGDSPIDEHTFPFEASNREDGSGKYAVVASITHRYVRDLIGGKVSATTIVKLEDASVMEPAQEPENEPEGDR